MNARALLRPIGLIVSAIAVAWIAVRFVGSGALDLLASAQLSPWRLGGDLVLAAAVYAIGSGFLALAWWRMMRTLATHAIPARPIMSAYAASQYAKYLPANVAHYAVRHAWIRRYGLAHSSIALASVLEIALLLLSALSLTLLAGTERLRMLPILDPRIAVPLLAVLIAALGIALHAARRSERFARFHIPPLPSLLVLAFCAACYLAFFLVSASLLYALARTLGFAFDDFPTLVAATCASWFAGFVVIGAPAGLGVREATFVALAGGALGEDRALLLIGLFRIVTFLGDTLFFAAGAALTRTFRKPAP